VRALVVLLLLASTASAPHAERSYVEDRELCTRGAVFRGPAIDLDVKDADVHDVYRLLSEVGRVNIVISGEVRAKVTLRLKRVAWQQVACAIAGVHKLQILVNGNVLLVKAAGAR
jgi:type II secretory pathway component HofQ